MFLRPGNYQGVPASQPSTLFAIPSLGGALGVRYGSYISQTGTAGTAFVLPQGAVPVVIFANVSEAFDGGTQSIRIGDGTTTNRWATSIDTGTVGFVSTGIVGSAMGYIAGSLTADTPVIVTRAAAAGGSATQGTLTVVCYYAMM
jgi:hypothetical protein